MGKPFEKVQQRVIRCFLAGVFALLPVIITVAVVVWVTDFLERFIGPKTVIGEQLSKLGLQFADDPSADGSGISRRRRHRACVVSRPGGRGEQGLCGPPGSRPSLTRRPG